MGLETGAGVGVGAIVGTGVGAGVGAGVEPLPHGSDPVNVLESVESKSPPLNNSVESPFRYPL